MASRREYEWISQPPLSEAACITVVAGGDSNAVLKGFGADPSARVDVARIDFDSLAYGGWVAAMAVPGGIVAVEDNGFQGSLPEVLARASSGGVAASIFWNVNHDNAFNSHAMDN